jgi:Arylsulfotransferase (ASST)
VYRHKEILRRRTRDRQLVYNRWKLGFQEEIPPAQRSVFEVACDLGAVSGLFCKHFIKKYAVPETQYSKAYFGNVERRKMRTTKAIVSFVALAVRAFGQACPPPTPVFSPAIVPAGETQPLELNGFQFTTSRVPTFPMASSLYGASGFPWVDCQHLTLTRITGAGTFLGISPSGGDYLVYEIGLTGTQAPAIVNQWSMQAANLQPPITGQQPLLDWDHEAIRLPNGWTAIVGSEEMLVTNLAQCPTAEFPTNYCDVLGDKIVVMDSAGNVQWVWDSFNASQFPYLDRPAVLGETCTPVPQGCPITLAPVAQDWLHANSLWYDPADGNLVINLRNQDWIVKVAYQNGAGDGSVVWRLGNAGDFTMGTTKVPSPWEDHPHDVTSPKPGVYSMFDNGNGRHVSSNGGSRGLIYRIDEAALEVKGVQDYPVHVYSPGAGSAQLLTNGNWMFLAGRPENASGIYSEEFEFAPNTLVPLWTEQLPQQYRVIRLSSLFYY